MQSMTPACTHTGLGSSAFARRYLRNRCFFLFLRVLRCFSSPGSPPYVMDWRMDTWGLLMWVSPFRNRRIKGYLLLPGAYRSLSRLSSALSAKASTICSFMLDQIDLCRFITQMLAPSVALIWFRFYNSFRLRNMVYRNHLVLILGHRLFSEVIQYFRCTLGCLDISSDIQCAVFKEQCLRW